MKELAQKIINYFENKNFNKEVSVDWHEASTGTVYIFISTDEEYLKIRISDHAANLELPGRDYDLEFWAGVDSPRGAISAIKKRLSLKEIKGRFFTVNGKRLLYDERKPLANMDFWHRVAKALGAKLYSEEVLNWFEQNFPNFPMIDNIREFTRKEGE